MMPRLERFKAAQDSSRSGFQTALDEIRAGGKSGHWIWYVFPQLAGLGSSPLSQSFAIDDEAEAADYLQDAELRSRLLTIASAVAEQLRKGKTLRGLMGSEIDAQKVVSSLTLFGHVARKLHEVDGTNAYDSVAAVADEVLAAAALQGYPACAYTLRRLGRLSERG
jgi:uncharacterized protein (DUF1810 family)